MQQRGSWAASRVANSCKSQQAVQARFAGAFQHFMPLSDVQKHVIERVSLHPSIRADVEVTPECRLREDLGFDSLDHVEVCLAVEQHLNCDWDDAYHEGVETVQDLINLVSENPYARPPMSLQAAQPDTMRMSEWAPDMIDQPTTDPQVSVFSQIFTQWGISLATRGKFEYAQKLFDVAGTIQDRMVTQRKSVRRLVYKTLGKLLKLDNKGDEEAARVTRFTVDELAEMVEVPPAPQVQVELQVHATIDDKLFLRRTEVLDLLAQIEEAQHGKREAEFQLQPTLMRNIGESAKFLREKLTVSADPRSIDWSKVPTESVMKLKELLQPSTVLDGFDGVLRWKVVLVPVAPGIQATFEGKRVKDVTEITETIMPTLLRQLNLEETARANLSDETDAANVVACISEKAKFRVADTVAELVGMPIAECRKIHMQVHELDDEFAQLRLPNFLSVEGNMRRACEAASQYTPLKTEDVENTQPFVRRMLERSGFSPQ